ncbi:golgin subfamily A member 6-like protein 22 [Helianthus annuus]|uniref:golgin subfamily A member 6-like protein 22 n=1 Tax=Helianthus annuus TaxID=4232 RepID=UPI0016532485|nr:golgin subfamily A member 6-like protein 22 [Helianthus annuus]
MKKNWKIEVKFSGNKYVVTDELGNKYEVRTSGAPPVREEDVEMEEEEEQEAEPSGAQGPRQRYMRPHREINAEVAGFVTRRRVPSYKNFDRGQQEIYDNVSACIGEGREYNQRREAWQGSYGASMQEYWDAQGAQRERMNKFMEEQELFQAMQRSHMEQLAKLQEDEAARRRKHLRKMEESDSEDEKAKKKKKVKTPVNNDDEEVQVIKRKVKEVPKFKVNEEVDARKIPVNCETLEGMKVFEDDEVSEEKTSEKKKAKKKDTEVKTSDTILKNLKAISMKRNLQQI